MKDINLKIENLKKWQFFLQRPFLSLIGTKKEQKVQPK